MSENTSENTRKQEMGALWKRESKNNGQKYLAGHVVVEDDMGVEQKVRVVVFANREKKNDKAPDFSILKAREYSSDSNTAPAQTTQQSTETVEEDVL
tara:strand:- start:482 stop:772 length:291 start_codon:yes stop_codon:yes gene_type:complete